MILIPDIHGRSFWKEAIKLQQDNEEIIFLGDYLDNYDGEIDAYTENVITKSTTLSNFKEILEVAKTNKNITLLLGNHDVEYFLPQCPDCRMNFNDREEIKNLFMENQNLFTIGCSYQEKNTIISHAGIIKSYLQFYFKDREISTNDFFSFINHLNNLWIDKNFNKLDYFLKEVGPERGGDSFQGGSPVWADFTSLIGNREDCPKQIVGHSQYNPILSKDMDPFFKINEYTACLDCRTAFRVDLDNWNFTPITEVKNVKYNY